MEYSHLISFLAVAEELHFAKAAEKLKISHPQLSRRIRALEESVNARLFSRSNKWKVELTASGRVFLPAGYAAGQGFSQFYHESLTCRMETA